MVNASDPGAIGSVRAWNSEPGSALYSMPFSESGSRKAPARFCSLMGDDPGLPLTSSPVPFVRSMARPAPRPPELMNEKSCSKADAGFLGSFFFALALVDALAFPAAAFPAPSFLALATEPRRSAAKEARPSRPVTEARRSAGPGPPRVAFSLSSPAAFFTPPFVLPLPTELLRRAFFFFASFPSATATKRGWSSPSSSESASIVSTMGICIMAPFGGYMYSSSRQTCSTRSRLGLLYSRMPLQNISPISSRSVMLKCIPARSPIDGPWNDASSVYAFVMPSSFQHTTRPVPSLDFCTLNEESTMEKRSGTTSFRIRGKTFSWIR